MLGGGSVDLVDALQEGFPTQFNFYFLFELFERRCTMKRPDWDIVYTHPVCNICVQYSTPDSYHSPTPRAECEC